MHLATFFDLGQGRVDIYNCGWSLVSFLGFVILIYIKLAGTDLVHFAELCLIKWHKLLLQNWYYRDLWQKVINLWTKYQIIEVKNPNYKGKKKKGKKVKKGKKGKKKKATKKKKGKKKKGKKKKAAQPPKQEEIVEEEKQYIEPTKPYLLTLG